MIPNGKQRGWDGSGQPPQERSWSDLQELARRVIRAANLAVLAHAELDSVAQPSPVAAKAGKKGD